LLAQVSTANAARHGVTIAAEALIDGAHRLILIVSAGNDTAVERFLGFLRQCGDLHVMAASTAEAAVERGGCDRPPPTKTGHTPTT
jgi:DNA-binding LacI/PurR family transcriptional regulator